uniref:Uncharacterized protein n=2 Tax=Haemonchus contortus TaxID=6289 RepID=W6NHQ3_HAECO
MEVVEHQRMRHTFALPYQLNPLSVQLFGDIFKEGKTDEPYLIHSSSCSPSKDRSITDQQSVIGLAHTNSYYFSGSAGSSPSYGTTSSVQSPELSTAKAWSDVNEHLWYV